MPISLASWLALMVAAVSVCAPIAHGQEPALRKTVRVEDARALGVGRLIPDVTLKPMEGAEMRLSAFFKDRKGVVLVMTSVDCPMVVKYAARIAAIEDEYTPKGIGFVYVNTVDHDTLEDMRRQIRQNRFDGPYLVDRAREVSRAVGALTTTEVFVLDAARTLVYRGAIDDQYGIGVALNAPRQTLLRDALDALLTGGRPRARATWAPGCVLEIEPVVDPEVAAPTYHGRIARIVADHCAACHRLGGGGPFPLTSMSDLLGRAPMIEAVLNDGLMPPWHGAVRGEGEPDVWVTDRSMREEDRRALIDWLRSSRPEGNRADAPVIPPLSQTWTIGTPDLLLSSAGFRLPADGGLVHERVTMAFPGAEDRWIAAAELRPIETGSVHHALVWLLHPGGTLPAPGEVPEGLELLATYSPGDNVLRYPAGAARRLPAGSVLLVDLYALPMGREMMSAMRMALRFADQPRMQVRTVVAGVRTLSAEPGAARTTDQIELTPPAGASILALTPYMRQRGHAAAVELVGADGAVRTLLDAPRYDFRWQIRYEFIEPVRVVSGSRLVARGLHDFSDPDAPTARAGQGIKTGSTPAHEAFFLAVDLLEPIEGR